MSSCLCWFDEKCPLCIDSGFWSFGLWRWSCLGRQPLGVAALLEEVCHWGQALEFITSSHFQNTLFMFLAGNVPSQLPAQATSCQSSHASMDSLPGAIKARWTSISCFWSWCFIPAAKVSSTLPTSWVVTGDLIYLFNSFSHCVVLPDFEVPSFCLSLSGSGIMSL